VRLCRTRSRVTDVLCIAVIYMERNIQSQSRPEDFSREQSQTPSELEQTSVARQHSPTASYNARIEAALERRLANGRESQRRFRERQKVFNNSNDHSSSRIASASEQRSCTRPMSPIASLRLLSQLKLNKLKLLHVC